MFPATEDLISLLSNFYSEFTFDTQSLDIIFDTYVNVVQMIEDYLKQIKDNLNVMSVEAYRNYPYRVVSTEGVSYTSESLLYDKNVSNKLNLDGKSLEERKQIWYNLNNTEKINILFNRGNYIFISAKRPIDSFEPKVVDFEAYDLQNRKLTRNADYILDGNKVFLIGDAAAPTLYNSRLILKEIKIDYNLPETLYGKNIGIPYSDIITKPEYRDFMQVLIYASLGGPTVKNIRNAFNTMANWANVDIVDIANAKGTRKQLWTSLSATSGLTPFEFLITVPIEQFNAYVDQDGNIKPDDEKLIMFNQFLNIIKPAYTKYMIDWVQHITDVLNISDSAYIKISQPTSDVLSGTDSVSTKAYQSDVYTIVMEQDDSVLNLFDTGILFDTDGEFDILVQIIDHPGAQGYNDLAEFKYITFPEFPLEFSASRNITTGNVAISFKDNAANITRYEILRNDIIILTAVGDGSGGTINVTDTGLNSQPSGSYKYCARSVYEINPAAPDQTKYSVKSKEITIIR